MIFEHQDCALRAHYIKEQEFKELAAPLRVRFQCRDEWIVIPEDECYPVCEPEDFAEAIGKFREKYEAYGPLLVDYSFDKEEWYRSGEIAGEDQYRCRRCGHYFGPRTLYEDEKGSVCLECVIVGTDS